MKIVGSKDVFAIEFDLQNVDGSYYYGDIWFWINGKQIGTDQTQVVPYISSSISFLKEFMSRKLNRRFIGSEKLAGEQLFFILLERFYDMFNPTVSDYNEASNHRENFSLESVGDSSFFDTVRIVLIDEPAANRQRFLWRLYKNNVLEEFSIPWNYFEEVSYSYIHQIENDIVDWKE